MVGPFSRSIFLGFWGYTISFKVIVYNFTVLLSTLITLGSKPLNKLLSPIIVYRQRLPILLRCPILISIIIIISTKIFTYAAIVIAL